jgi:hypothetical protein
MSERNRRGPVETYLDELVRAMTGRPPRELRVVLAEAEAHLYDDVDAAIAHGVPREQAERDAVARFGPAIDLALAERRRARPTLREILAQLVRAAVLLAGVGAVAVGISGLVAAVIRLVGGNQALVGVARDRVLSGSDCARWLAVYPHAGNCHAAAVADWADETVYYRLAAGVLGVLLLAGYRVLRRRARPPLPALRTLRDAVGAAAFGLAAAYTLVTGINAAQVGGGVGQWFSAAPVATVGAAVFGVLLLRDLRQDAG